MLRKVGFRIFIGPPYRRQARRFRRHDVDAVAIVRRHGSDAGADKFHDFIFNVTVFKDGTDDGDGNIMRTDGRIRFTGQIDADDTGIGNVNRYLREAV